MRSDQNDGMLVRQIVETLEHTGRFQELKRYVQHGNVSVYEHSVRVALTALGVAYKLPVRVDYSSLVRGALLHDYFLYDWHAPNPQRPSHALYHPRIAFKNAERDYGLNPTEADIIRRHMFPLVPIPPRTREGWIVCWADTYCALIESINPRRIRTAVRNWQKKRLEG